MENTDLRDSIPPGTYAVRKDPRNGNLFLAPVENFTLPAERYGDNDKRAKKMLKTFRDRAKATGALLAGEKGSGKSLLGKTISVFGREQNIPTIVINEPWCGEQFNIFIQSISQPCLVMFDEFEKVYDAEHQTAVLTLLDGMYPSDKMYLFTCNDKYKLDFNMRNRPGRIYYALDFDGLAVEFIEEYLIKNLNNKNLIQPTLNITLLFNAFNFDMLHALVEEMNRYDETAQEALKMLNIRAEYDSYSNWKIKLTSDTEHILTVDTDTWTGNPLTKGIGTYYYSVKHADLVKAQREVEPEKLKDHLDDISDYKSVSFTTKDLIKIDPKSKIFEFQRPGFKLVATKEVYKVPEAHTFIM
jgi:hypothetical protein